MLRVRLKPSPLLAAAFTAAHLAAALTLIPLDLPLWAKLLITLPIAASLVHALRHTAFLRSPTSPIALELKGADGAAIQTRNGDWHGARILGTTYVSPLLTVLNLRLQGRRTARHVVIVPDGIGAEDFRKLRVRLRWDYRTETPGSRDAVSS